MKKVFVFVLGLFFSISLANFQVNAYDSNMIELSYAKQIVESVYTEEGYTHHEIKQFDYKFEKVFDIDLNFYGYFVKYTHQTKDEKGFTIIKFDNKDVQQVIEFHKNTLPPYQNKNLINVYAGYGKYLEKDGNIFLDSYTNKTYDYYQVKMSSLVNNEVQPSGFKLGSISYSATELHQFDVVTMREKTFEFGYPMVSTSDFTGSNNCSPTAAVSLIAYFDGQSNFLYDLNPKNTSGMYKKYSNYSSVEKSVLNNLHQHFYDSMETNSYINSFIGYLWGGAGTVPSYFFRELKNYMYDKGYNLINTDIIESVNSIWGYVGESMTGSNWDLFKSLIDQNKPVVLQLGVENTINFTMIKKGPSSNPDEYMPLTSNSVSYTYETYNIPSAHTVVAYGYRTYDFYHLMIGPNYGYTSWVRQDRFMVVANGWGGTSYVNASHDDIGMAYGLHIVARSGGGTSPGDGTCNTANFCFVMA